MTPDRLAHTFQIVDSLFPVGGFAYSDGLEAAAAGGLIHEANSVAGWLDHSLWEVFVPCDGLAFLKCFRAARHSDWDAIRMIDHELSALKPAGATRASSRSIGKRLLKTYATLFEDRQVNAAIETMPQCNAAVGYAIAFFKMGLDEREGLSAFAYLRMAAIVSAALRLISMGQLQGQTLLTEALRRLPEAVDFILNSADQPLRCFAPVMDIQQMNHRYVYSRLFLS